MPIFICKAGEKGFESLLKERRQHLFAHVFDTCFRDFFASKGRLGKFLEGKNRNLEHLYKRALHFELHWFKVEPKELSEDKWLNLEVKSRDRGNSRSKAILPKRVKELSDESALALAQFHLNFSREQLNKLFSQKFFIGRDVTRAFLEGTPALPWPRPRDFSGRAGQGPCLLEPCASVGLWRRR